MSPTVPVCIPVLLTAGRTRLQAAPDRRFSSSPHRLFCTVKQGPHARSLPLWLFRIPDPKASGRSSL